jgi:hypothetical protein
MINKTYGQIAYEAGSQFLLTNHPPDDLPPGGFEEWRDLDPPRQQYWEAVGRAVGLASLPLTGMIRFELIDIGGRRLVMLGAPTTLSVQDEGCTLKVFVEGDVGRQWLAQNDVTSDATSRDLEQLRGAIKAFADHEQNHSVTAGEAFRSLLKKAGL